MSTRRTEGIGSGLLPTVKANESKRNLVNGKNRSLTTGQRFGIGIEQMAKSGLLPTPNCMDVLPPKEGEAMEKLANGARAGRTAPSNLREYVNPASWDAYINQGLIPTPTATSDSLGGCTRSDEKRQSDTLAHHIHAATNATPGTTTNLNPAFVAEMMGFPPDWTELPFEVKPRDFPKHEGWDSFPTQWPTEQEKKGYDGISHSKWRNGSIKGYGNAVVPPLVLQIFKAIGEYEARN